MRCAGQLAPQVNLMNLHSETHPKLFEEGSSSAASVSCNSQRCRVVGARSKVGVPLKSFFSKTYVSTSGVVLSTHKHFSALLHGTHWFVFVFLQQFQLEKLKKSNLNRFLFGGNSIGILTTKQRGQTKRRRFVSSPPLLSVIQKVLHACMKHEDTFSF